MRAFDVTIARESKHWHIELKVEGGVEPRAIFGCREGMLPFLGGLMLAQSQMDAIAALPESDPARTPPTVTVRMPSGRLLTFTGTSAE
jgi:hypothetical protein